MHLPEIDRYASLSSPLHSWDPRLKLVSLSTLLVSLVLTENLLLAFLGLLVALGLVLLSRIPLRFVLIHLRWVLLPVLFFFLVLPLTVPGGGTFSCLFFNVSGKGLRMAALIGLRAVGAVLLIFPLVGTMRFDVTLQALRKLKMPEKFIQMIMFTYRYIFVLLDELKKMSTAARARLFKKRTDLYTLKVTGNLTGMLFVRGLERTQRVYNAMVSRGYQGSVKTLEEFRLASSDFIKASLVILTAVVLDVAGLFL